MAAITGAEGQHSRDIGRDLPLKTAVLHKRRCSTRAIAFKFALAPQFYVLNGNDAAHPAEHLAIGPYEPATVILCVT